MIRSQFQPASTATAPPLLTGRVAFGHDSKPAVETTADQASSFFNRSPLAASVTISQLPQKDLWEQHFPYNVIMDFIKPALETLPESRNKVVDYMAGHGSLSLRVAQANPHLQVLAVDMRPANLKQIQADSAELKLTNVHTARVKNAFAAHSPIEQLGYQLSVWRQHIVRFLLGLVGIQPPPESRNIPPLSPQSLGIPLGRRSADVVLMCSVSHGIDREKRSILKEAYRVLKPGGIILMINWRKIPETPRQDVYDQLPTVKQMQQQAQQSGFRVEEFKPLGKFHYGLMLRKPELSAR